MRNSIILLGAAAGLAGCGQSADDAQASNAAANSAEAKPKPAYCFFKDAEMKGWAAKADRDGNIVVTGKAYRSDSRYRALLSPAAVSGTTAEVAPTITPNDTGFGAPENWWDVSETIPNSQAVTAVDIKCGAKTVATLTVPRKK
ncbi:MAG TPA: hypothetical protein VGM04_05095 [Sphingomicrobium sp.]|jgi:hypothetical protein